MKDGSRRMEARVEFEGLHADLTEKVIGIAYTVSNELGFGFLESVYKKAMLVALRQAGMKAEEEVQVPVSFRGVRVGIFFADIVVNDLLILELKASTEITRSAEAQLIHYLRATSIEVGLILAFDERVKHKRFILTNDRKRLT